MSNSDAFLNGLAARLTRRDTKPTPVVVSRPAPAQVEAASEFMRLSDAAAFAQVSRPTLSNWERLGLKVYRPSKGVALVRRTELESFIVRGATAANN